MSVLGCVIFGILCCLWGYYMGFKQAKKECKEFNIVHCKDCKYYLGEFKRCAFDFVAKENDFCSYGDRRKL